MTKVVLLFLILLVIILIATYLTLRISAINIDEESTQNDKLNTLERWFDDIHQRNKFNGTVLLAQGEKIVFSKSYGSNFTKEPYPLTQHSSYNLASVSKQFTAMGIVILKQQNKLTYDDKITAYIPELSMYDDMTIEQLLHHTSGIPDYMHLINKYHKGTDIITIQEIISIYQQYLPNPNFEPGSKFQYSNTGYILLAEIIQRVSGMHFETFMSENIFRSLEMHDTQVFNLLSENEPQRRVFGYKQKFWIFGGKKVLHDLNHFDGVVGDGGIYSSANDLYLWHKALSNGTLVSKDAYKVAYTPAKLLNGKQNNYGFGWFINDDSSVEHAGGWQGFTSYIYRDLTANNLIIILDNSTNTLRVNSFGFTFNSIGKNLKAIMKKL